MSHEGVVEGAAISYSDGKRVAVVTGSSSGIGKAVVDLLRFKEYRVVGLSRSEGCDVTDQAAVAKAFGGVQAVDLLVHAAGARDEEMEPLGAVCLSALLWHGRAALTRSQGAVVVVSSVAAGRKEYGAYGVAKAKMEDFARSMVPVLAADRVRLSIVRPHYIGGTRSHPEGVAPEKVARIPLGYEGRPEDVAALIVALGENRYVTGVVVACDGGWSACGS